MSGLSMLVLVFAINRNCGAHPTSLEGIVRFSVAASFEQRSSFSGVALAPVRHQLDAFVCILDRLLVVLQSVPHTRQKN